MNYRSSLNLPADLLPMRANLPEREPHWQKFWEEAGIYRKSLDRECPRGDFIFHDGPPYSNGDIHIGTALNKILKDFVSRRLCMQGYRIPYVPGWDNHGMPIEFHVSQAARKAGEKLDLIELRRRCREHAARYVEIQRGQFRRLGGRADWDHPYLTMDPEFEASVVEVFAELALADYVYRGLRPILWCPYDETALAEAEVEYAEKTSNSIYVRFPVQQDPAGIFPGGSEAYLVIWTTTPWTIPANLALAVHPDFEYLVAKVDGAFYLTAAELLPATAAAAGWEAFQEVSRHSGRELLGLVCRHPLQALDPVFDRPSPVVEASYVTLDAGTGIVHTAPGHGADDFKTGRAHGLEVLSPVDARGRFTSEAGPFAGRAIRSGDADTAVLEALAASGNLLSRQSYRHSYPHCWRCKGPLIFRTTVQWFMSIDHLRPDGRTHRELCRDEIDRVSWMPPEGSRRIGAMIAGRPDWCLSRQRAWGVGIPVFYCDACSEPILTSESLQAAIDLVRSEGADAWFTRPAGEILPGFRCPHCSSSGSFSKETDVLDVWFDSGSTWYAVLDRHPELHSPADLYLEGSDQHRGWFNSSLTLSAALRGRAPYRSVLTHGFVLDQNGEKMSKSRGNVTSPQDEIARGGADILRLWVASTDYFDDVRIGGPILEHVRNVFLRIRNTLRFMIGNLADFDPAVDMVPEAGREEIDRYALHLTHQVLAGCGAAYEKYLYHDVFHQVQNFCTGDLGGFYLDVIKDRLYCEEAGSLQRRSAQSTLYQIVDHLTRLIAPILVHTAEEVWQVLPGARERHESVHLARFPDAHDLWRSDELAARYARLRDLRDRFNAALEPLKPRSKGDTDFLLKSSLEAVASIHAGPDWIAELRRAEAELPAVLMCPVVDLHEATGPGVEIRIGRAPGPRCERCWLHQPEVGSLVSYPELCARCAAVIDSRGAGEEG